MSLATIDVAPSEPLTEDRVQEIVTIDDPALRNLWITQTYADLAERLLAIVRTDQTWCTFAIWASNTAGVSIRGHELPHVVEELLDGAGEHADAVAEHASRHHRLVRWLAGPVHRSHVDSLVRRALGQVSAHIAHGNTLVFAELAPLFVRLIDRLEADGSPDPQEVEHLLDEIGVPDDAEDPLVRTAFRHYALAPGADRETDRAQHVLAANVAAVLHEQRRLQADVAASLDAGLVDVGETLDGACHRLLPSPVRRLIVDAARRRAAPHVERLWCHVATRLMMTLEVPGEVLHLGVDVPAPPQRPLFPAALARIDAEPLRSLMAEWDPTDGTGVGSAAADWADLHQRMGYIVNLFRSRQQVVELTASPFSAAQLTAMRAGRMPADV